jgi:putative ABC transport system substrate-binding protein
MPVIGILNTGVFDSKSEFWQSFRQGLSEQGLAEGRNVTSEYRSAENHIERMPTLAADLARRQVNAIVVTVVPAALAAQAATRTIPIIFALGVDPTQFGLVAGLNRPGGNLTGVNTLGGEMGAKRMELLHEVVPKATLVGALLNPANPADDSQAKELVTAAKALGVRLQIVVASTAGDFDLAFDALHEARADALVICNDPLFNAHGRELAALALRQAIPAIFQFPEFAQAGGLISYGSGVTQLGLVAGAYTGRILKGERPGDLPVQQATKIEFVINLKTAKALGLTIPETLLATADEVIQ